MAADGALAIRSRQRRQGRPRRHDALAACKAVLFEARTAAAA